MTEFTFVAEQPEHHDRIEILLDKVFGTDRRNKTTYKLRTRGAQLDALSFVCVKDGVLQGTIRYWPVRIGQEEALLLGPLAIEPEIRGCGLGLQLMRHSLALAGDQGYQNVILVGDQPYYARAGFAKVRQGKITLPGPVDPDRLLFLELQPGSFKRLTGQVEAAGRGCGPWPRT